MEIGTPVRYTPRALETARRTLPIFVYARRELARGRVVEVLEPCCGLSRYRVAWQDGATSDVTGEQLMMDLGGANGR